MKIIGNTVGTTTPKPNLKQTDPKKGDFVHGKDEIPAKVSQLENDSGYLTEHQDISGKLDANKLPEAINTALAQAKASGEFNGKDGQDGKNGVDGKDGYTPVKGVDYFDGAQGIQGEKGDKGDQGEPGADGAKGEKGDKGDPGEKGADGAKGDKGDKGDPGAAGENGKDGVDGKTPVKGTDYWTSADKSEMVSSVLAALPTWTGGSY